MRRPDSAMAVTAPDAKASTGMQKASMSGWAARSASAASLPPRSPLASSISDSSAGWPRSAAKRS
jgi:hypothetical protein